MSRTIKECSETSGAPRLTAFGIPPAICYTHRLDHGGVTVRVLGSPIAIAEWFIIGNGP